jgi:hypothetical protein
LKGNLESQLQLAPDPVHLDFRGIPDRAMVSKQAYPPAWSNQLSGLASHYWNQPWASMMVSGESSLLVFDESLSLAADHFHKKSSSVTKSQKSWKQV